MNALSKCLATAAATLFFNTVQASEIVVINGDRYLIPAEKIRREKLDDAHLTIMGLTLGKRSLTEVQAKLGTAKILPAGEHQPHRICYVSSNPADRTVVVFEAGPLGGWEYLTAFSIVDGETMFKETALCTPSQAITRDVATQGGIKLRESRAALKGILGEPTHEDSAQVLYMYRVQERLSTEQLEKIKRTFGGTSAPLFYDVSAYVEVRFQGCRIIAVRITKIESM